MSFDEKAFFVVRTPLNVEVRTTTGYWKYLTTMKHPVMKGNEDIVEAALQFPYVSKTVGIEKPLPVELVVA